MTKRKKSARCSTAHGSSKGRIHTHYARDNVAQRIPMFVPIKESNDRRDNRPTANNINRWHNSPAMVTPVGPWQAVESAILLPVAAHKVRQRGCHVDRTGGDAGKTLRQASLDRASVITCVLVCKHCGDVGFAIEVMHEEANELSFYRRGARGEWGETNIRDEVVAEMANCRPFFMTFAEGARAHAQKIDTDEFPDAS